MSESIIDVRIDICLQFGTQESEVRYDNRKISRKYEPLVHGYEDLCYA